MPVKINEFPSNAELARIKTLGKYRKLNNNNQLEVLSIHELIKKQYKTLADMVYLAHAIPGRITEFYGDFVQGDVDRMIISAPTDAQADNKWVENVVFENDLKEKVSDYGEDQSEYGFCVLLGYTDEDGNYIMQNVPADQYFPQADGSVVFATYRKDPASRDSKQLLLHVQHYIMENGKCQLYNQAFRTSSDGVAIEVYSLEAMGQLVGRTLVDKQEIEIDELPIRQADNGRRTKYGFGKSDYHDILPQLAEINERTTHVSTQLLKNIDAKLIVPNTQLDPETGKMKYSEAFIMDSKDDIVPQYLINQNPLLADVREHVMLELKFIEWISCVPMWALTRAGAMVERVEALRIQLFGAVRKTSKKRSKIKRAMLDMLRIGAKMTGQSESLQNDDCVIDFTDVLPVDELTQVQVESEKIRSGISSRSSSMIRIENYTTEEAQKELEKIKTEDTIAGVGNSDNAPTL